MNIISFIAGTGAVLATSFGVNIISIPTEKVSEAIVTYDTEADLLDKADGTETDYPKSIKDEELPSFYTSDLTDNKDYITDVRNQGYTALCWDFAAIGAIESDLLIHHDELSVSELNLSEKHAAYYNMHRAEGSAGKGIDKDYREFVYEDKGSFLGKYDTGYLSVGGVTNYCLSLFTAWKGPVMDKNNNSIHAIKGQYDMYTQNADKPSDAYTGCFCHVQGVYEVPATAKNRDLIKRLIMEHGSVTASICADDNFWTGRKTALYDYKRYGDGNVADHEVLIVGWKDDYPAENFITRPKEDGAFICRNSWGAKYGTQGYFYLSYEDSILTANNVAAYECAMPGDSNWYDKNYQYAGFLTHIMDPMLDQNNVVYMYDESQNAYGITFSPEESEKLSAIGYYSMSTDIEDEVSIYELKDISMHLSPDSSLLRNPFENKSSGVSKSSRYWYYDEDELPEPIITMDCKAITGGYHTFSLEKPIDIDKNKTILIVVKPGKPAKLVYEKAMDYTTEPFTDNWKNDQGAIHTVNTASGHSFMMDDSGEKLIRLSDKDLFIKAYTITETGK